MRFCFFLKRQNPFGCNHNYYNQKDENRLDESITIINKVNFNRHLSKNLKNEFINFVFVKNLQQPCWLEIFDESKIPIYKFNFSSIVTLIVIEIVMD